MMHDMDHDDDIDSMDYMILDEDGRGRPEYRSGYVIAMVALAAGILFLATGAQYVV